MATKKPDAALVKSLAEVPLFAECSAKQLRTIASTGKVLTKRDGATILAEDTSGVAFFLILSGTVDIHRDGQVLAKLMPGEFFGEMALLGSAHRNASATAAGEVEVFALSAWSFKGILLADAKIAYGVAVAVAARASAR